MKSTTKQADYKRTTLDMSHRTLKQIRKNPIKPVPHVIVHTETRLTYGGMTDWELIQAKQQAAKYKKEHNQ